MLKIISVRNVGIENYMDNIMNGTKIGLVKLRDGTDEKTWRRLEEFFISKGLFISSTPKGIVVTDTEKAKKCIMEIIDNVAKRKAFAERTG